MIDFEKVELKLGVLQAVGKFYVESIRQEMLGNTGARDAQLALAKNEAEKYFDHAKKGHFMCKMWTEFEQVRSRKGRLKLQIICIFLNPNLD